MLLAPKEVGARLRVSQRTVYLWIEQGRLPAIRLSERVTRVSEAAVEALIDRASASTAYSRTADAGALPGEIAAEAQATYCLRCGAIVDPTDGRSPTERLRALLSSHREELLRIAAAHKASNVRVFGSVARGDAHFGSDIDFIVDLGDGATLLDLGGIQSGFEDALGCRVDVGGASALKDEMRDRVLAEAVPL